ncbi:TetR/AcrR family transcriptional regulator [Clostridiisalibacter paucivorans]|uniref:TetR/AcrR family transcriptional regulator n=1 Tax=Clostridiisalibacter paucivorans TaxID=408753 RepID=UPI00047E6910|nr:TetR/AcrR family transcriptional regulator [Clostridiisalibacter paucivorans]
MTNIEKRQSEKRKMIIDKATELMNEVGFERMTVRMICEAANISAGTFYHYFENKSELIIELFGLIDGYFRENVLQRLNHEDEIVNIIKFCEGFAEFVTLTGVPRSKLINSMFPIYSRGGHHEEKGRILYSELNKIISRGQKKGQITTAYSTDKLVDMIIVIIRGYCFDWARREGPYDLVEYTTELIELFVKGLKPNK